MTNPKMLEKSQKQKPTCNSAFHFSLHFHKLCLYKTTLKYWKLCSQLLKMRKPKTPEKSQKNKTNSQQCISLHITLTQIMPLQNDAKVLEIMFPAAEND